MDNSDHNNGGLILLSSSYKKGTFYVTESLLQAQNLHDLYL